MIEYKILLVSSAFYPEISPRSFRATELAKEFCRQGHQVTVISKYRDHDFSEFLKEFPVRLKMWEKPRYPKVPDYKRKAFSVIGRGISRMLSVLFEYPGIEEMFRVKEMLRYENGYDLMISFAVPYPVHWGAAWSRSVNHRIAGTWIADCGDPYMGDVLDSFRKPFYFGYLEKWFCRKADFITIPVETAMQAYYHEFHEKIRIIPQGFDFELNESDPAPQEKHITQFAYAGGFLRGIRDPGPLLRILTDTDLPFKFHIFTDQIELFDEYADVLQDKLVLSRYIPRPELMKALKQMDFLINFDNHTSRNVPSKLIDYAIADRPVLNIDRNFTPELLVAFLKGDYSHRMALPDPKRYHIRNISGQFLELLS